VLTVDQSLDAGDDIAINSLGLDLETVRNGGEGRVSPAGAAVDRDVLVQVSSQQTLFTVVQRYRQILRLNVSVRLRCLQLFASGEAVVELVAVSINRQGEGRDDGSGQHFEFEK
jgi:hypothetical protein